MFEPKFEDNHKYNHTRYIYIYIQVYNSSSEKFSFRKGYSICNFSKTELLLRHYSRILPADRVEQNVQYRRRI